VKVYVVARAASVAPTTTAIAPITPLFVSVTPSLLLTDHDDGRTQPAAKNGSAALPKPADRDLRHLLAIGATWFDPLEVEEHPRRDGLAGRAA
jgi:hypothetical protein